MPRSANELMRLWMAHKAAADALEGELKGRALDAHEAGELAAGPIPGLGRVELRLSKDAARIVPLYEQAFLAYLVERCPDEVVVVRALRNPNFGKFYLDNYGTPVDPDELPAGHATMMVNVNDGSVIPGAEWTRGGRLDSVALVRDSSVKSRLGRTAKQYAMGAGVMPGLPSGEVFDGENESVTGPASPPRGGERADGAEAGRGAEPAHP